MGQGPGEIEVVNDKDQELRKIVDIDHQELRIQNYCDQEMQELWRPQNIETGQGDQGPGGIGAIGFREKCWSLITRNLVSGIIETMDYRNYREQGIKELWGTWNIGTIGTKEYRNNREQGLGSMENNWSLITKDLGLGTIRTLNTGTIRNREYRD